MPSSVQLNVLDPLHVVFTTRNVIQTKEDITIQNELEVVKVDHIDPLNRIVDNWTIISFFKATKYPISHIFFKVLEKFHFPKIPGYGKEKK